MRGDSLALTHARNSCHKEGRVDVFLYALVAGLAVSIPPGPLGAMCVIQTTRNGLRAGLAVGLSVAVVDGMLYGSIAALGADSVGGLPAWVRRVAAGLVAAALFYIGYRVFRRAGEVKPDDEPGRPGRKGGRYRAAGAATLIAIGTPGTLPALLVIFASFGVDNVGLGATGVFLGGLAWWWSLCLVTHFVREHAEKALHILDYACGALMWLGAGAAAKFAIFP